MLIYQIGSTGIHDPPFCWKTSLLNISLHPSKEKHRGRVSFLSISVLGIHYPADIFRQRTLVTPGCYSGKGHREWMLLHLLVYFLAIVHSNSFAYSKNWNMNLPYWVNQKPQNINLERKLGFSQQRFLLCRKEKGINYEGVLNCR